MDYINLVAKERNVVSWPNYFGRLYGEGMFILATSNFRLPRDKDHGGSNPLSLTEAYQLLVYPIRFAEAEARFYSGSDGRLR